MRPPYTPLLTLTLTAVLSLGCAQLPQMLAARASEAPALEVRGPGAQFSSVEAAAIDALTYCYLQAREARDAELMRGGTIHVAGDGYSYSEIHVAKPLTAHRIRYTLGPQDVARFQSYPHTSRFDVDRANERPSQVDRRSVDVIDPLHRPLYILHPSLAIREYRGADHESVEVADLRNPTRALAVAGN